MLRKKMKRPLWIVLMFLLLGCAGPGKQIPINLSYPEGTAPAAQSPSQKVVVYPFEDLRKDPSAIGRRKHLFGEVDTFQSNTPVGERVAQIWVAALQRRGWNARLARSGEDPGEVDRVIRGKVEVLWAEATSRVGYTEINAQAVLLAETLETKPGTTLTLKIREQNIPKVFFFSSERLEEILSELISEGIDRNLS
ncbi:MAG: hypothetical protein HY282_00055 [Nitrospirae bacterium]|nr:hypothetical protein [Candidatus Manganitrophaceae bacterium]